MGPGLGIVPESVAVKWIGRIFESAEEFLRYGAGDVFHDYFQRENEEVREEEFRLEL